MNLSYASRLAIRFPVSIACKGDYCAHNLLKKSFLEKPQSEGEKQEGQRKKLDGGVISEVQPHPQPDTIGSEELWRVFVLPEKKESELIGSREQSCNISGETTHMLAMVVPQSRVQGWACICNN